MLQRRKLCRPKRRSVRESRRRSETQQKRHRPARRELLRLPTAPLPTRRGRKTKPRCQPPLQRHRKRRARKLQARRPLPSPAATTLRRRLPIQRGRVREVAAQHRRRVLHRRGQSRPFRRIWLRRPRQILPSTRCRPAPRRQRRRAATRRSLRALATLSTPSRRQTMPRARRLRHPPLSSMATASQRQLTRWRLALRRRVGAAVDTHRQTRARGAARAKHTGTGTAELSDKGPRGCAHHMQRLAYEKS